MVELARRYPLDGVARPGTNPEGVTPALTLTVRNGVAHVLLRARKGRAEAVAAALALAAAPGRATVAADYVACPTAPGEWAVTAEWGDDGALASMVRTRLGGAGHVSEQSHGRQTVRVAGPAARELMTRLCRLDLHPRTASPGFCAQSPVADIACLVHVLDPTPALDLVVAAGYAEAFWHRLTESAAPFGYRVEIEKVGP